MNRLTLVDLTVKKSNNPIETLLQQTGWSPEEALLRLTDYHSNTSGSDGITIRVEESDSDVEIIEETFQKDNNVNLQDSAISIELSDDEPDLINKSTVIDTPSFSDKSENTCVLLTDKTVPFDKINNIVPDNSKIKNLTMCKKKNILKKYLFLEKQRINREIEKTKKIAAEVRKRLKLQLELLREKKKPKLKFLFSQPDDAQKVSENSAIVNNENVVVEKNRQEETNDVLGTGDSELKIVNVVGGYESPVREETNYDLDDLFNDTNQNRMESHLNSMENVVSLYDQHGNSFKNNVPYHIVPQLCDMMTHCIDNEMEEVLNGNENLCVSNKILILEDDRSNGNIEESPEFTTEEVLNLNENSSADVNPISEDDQSNGSSHSKTSTKLKICENIEHKLEFEKSNNTEANLDKTRSTGNVLRSLSENIFSTPVVNAIIPTKTKDITKIKGWKNKSFVECEEGKFTVSKESSIIEAQKENICDASPFVSSKQLHQVANTPKSVNGIQELKSTIDNFTVPTVSTVITTSNVNEPSTSAASLASMSISTISTELIDPFDHNIALPEEDLDTAIISTTSIMSTTNTGPIAHSEASPVSTISTVALPSNSTTILTNTNKKPISLVGSKLTLTADEVLFDRESYRISSDITKTYNGKKLKVTSIKNNQVLTCTKNRKKISKAPGKTPQVSNIKKPSLLDSLNKPPEKIQYDPTQWETVEVKLPKVSISVVPQYGQVIHPKLEHLIGNENWYVTETRANFALSLLRTKYAKATLRSFKFTLPYENDQKTMKMKKKIPVAIEPGEVVITESDDAIQTKKNLAKVEKEFTQTIIKTDDQLIMLGDSKQRRRRITRTPKKYNDYFNEDLTDRVSVDIHQLSTDGVVLPDNIKPCSVLLTKCNLNEKIPYCMIHSMHRCACIYTSDPAGLLAISPVTKAESLKIDTGKTRKPYKYKAAPRPDGLVRPAVAKLTCVRKQKGAKTLNKEEFCSRTRGISTDYITRNTMEFQLEKILKSSKMFSRNLHHYVDSLQVKFKELKRTSRCDVPKDVTKEERERELVRQTIEKLSPFLRSERHLDNITTRLHRRMNGIVTPETVRRKLPTDIAELGLIDIQETHVDSSRQKVFRLLPWTTVQSNYNSKIFEIWYLNTTKISPIIITRRNERPSGNHCNIRVFERLQEEASIPLDFIRWIIHKEVPMNKNPDNIFVAVEFNKTECFEVYSVLEKLLENDNLKTQFALLRQIKQAPPTKVVDVENVTSNEIDEQVIEEDQTEEEILEGEFQHYGMHGATKVMNYHIRKFKPHSLFYEYVNSSFFVTKREVRFPLPREANKCKWRLIYTDQSFSYLRLSYNNFSISYCDIMKFVQLARKKRKTVILTSNEMRKYVSNQNFGIYCVPNYFDKVFVGPYSNEEDHHTALITSQLDQFGAIKESIRMGVTNGLWVNQIDNYEDCEDSTCSITPDNCIDLTEDEDELKVILKNWNCNNLLQILGCPSECVQNNDDKDTTNYEQDIYWSDLNLLMNEFCDFDKSQNKCDNEIMELICYSIENKTTIRYFITNIPGLGYIKAFLHDFTNGVDILCPLTNQIRRFPNYNSAVHGITRILFRNLIMLPFKGGVKVAMMEKLNPTMKTPLSSTVLDGFHVAGSFGVQNIRGSSKKQLKTIGLQESEIEFVVLERNNRQIYYITNQLAKSFSLGGTSSQRSHGDVLTEVMKKIISTLQLSPDESAIKNIEKSLKLINSYPTSITSKIYKQLEYFAKKELSAAKLQKIRSSQTRKSVRPKSPSSFISETIENAINLETQVDVSSSNINKINLLKNKIEIKPSIGKDMKFKENRRSLPNKNSIVSKFQEISNLSTNDITITKLDRFHSFNGTVVAKKDKKTYILGDDDVLIEPVVPSTIQTTQLESLVQDQKQRELKKRALQLEDKVIIQPEPKRLKSNIQNDVVVRPELKNRIIQLHNGAVQSQFEKSGVQINIVVAPPKFPTRKALPFLMATENTTNLLKGKYVNLMPLKGKSKRKYKCTIVPNKTNVGPLRHNKDVTKQNGKNVLVTPQNDESLLVPQSTNGTTITTLTKASVQRNPVNIPNEYSPKLSISKTTPFTSKMAANQKSTSNLDKSSSSFITIQNGNSMQRFKVIKKNVDSVKGIRGPVFRVISDTL